MVGGIIWWFLSDIYYVELHNPTTTPCTLRTWCVQFLWPIDFVSSSNHGQHHNMVGGVIWWVLSEIQSLELCNPSTTPCTIWTSYEHEVSNFFDQLISDHGQNLGNIIIWSEESFDEFWVKSNHENYAILLPHHVWYELRTNLKCPISLTNRFWIKPRTCTTSQYGWRSHFVSFEWNPTTTIMQCTNHSMYGSNFVRTWCVQFLDQLISNRGQNLGNIIIWWEESFGEFRVKSNH